MERQPNNQQPSRSPNRKRWIAAVTLLLVVAVAAAFFLTRGSRGGLVAGRPVPEPSGKFAAAANSSSAGFASRPGDVMVEISTENLSNAHLKIEQATAQPSPSMPGGVVRTTGTV